MNSDWQSWAALAVVGLTAGLFVWRFVRKRRRKKSGSGGAGCGQGCGCATTKSGLNKIGTKKER